MAIEVIHLETLAEDTAQAVLKLKISELNKAKTIIHRALERVAGVTPSGKAWK